MIPTWNEDNFHGEREFGPNSLNKNKNLKDKCTSYGPLVLSILIIAFYYILIKRGYQNVKFKG